MISTTFLTRSVVILGMSETINALINLSVSLLLRFYPYYAIQTILNASEKYYFSLLIVSTPKNILGLPQRTQRLSQGTQLIEYQIVRFALIEFSWRALRFLPLFGVDSIFNCQFFRHTRDANYIKARRKWERRVACG